MARRTIPDLVLSKVTVLFKVAHYPITDAMRYEPVIPRSRDELEAAFGAAGILDAIRSGRDIWVFDQYIGGPDNLERARKVLIEKCEACSDLYSAAFLTSIIRGLEKG
jgi:hypothetical protein